MPTLAPWIATQNTPSSPPQSANRTVLANRLDTVLTTTRRETAARPHQRADEELINPNQTDHGGHHKTF